MAAGGKTADAHPIRGTVQEKKAAFEWLREQALAGNRHAAVALQELVDLNDQLRQADKVCAALQDMGDYWAYGMAKADDAVPTEEDDRALATITSSARSALDAYYVVRPSARCRR